MLVTIQNENLLLRVETLGAEMMELQSASGTQYLWDGNEKYWSGRAPVLFPYVARLTNNQYTLYGKPYPMELHGFAGKSEFSVESQTQTAVTFCLQENAETLRQYPFRFCFRVSYELRGWDVLVTYRVSNPDETELIFGIGGHPAFRVPLTDDTTFEDYEIRFPCVSQPDRVGFSETCYLTGYDDPFPLESGCVLPLRHDLFDQDAIILKNMPRTVTLCTSKAPNRVTVTYPQMPYLGIWHMPHTDAPYVCLEPWCSLPSRQDVVEELSCQSSLIHLAPHGEYQNCWTISISE